MTPDDRPVLGFMGGHLVIGRVVSFPHLCPGEVCAIRDWCWRTTGREKYEVQFVPRPPSQRERAG